MIIRNANPGDALDVRLVVAAAFGQQDEADLVDALSKDDDAVISLVAENEGEIVGHVLFSKLQSPNQCLALAPLSVTPNKQRQGIGSKLICEGLRQVKHEGWQAVFVLGEPDYYSRFGFSVAAADRFETQYPKSNFMVLEFVANSLDKNVGTVVYAPTFLALG